MEKLKMRIGGGVMLVVLLLLADLNLIQASPAHRIHTAASIFKDDNPTSDLKASSSTVRELSDGQHPKLQDDDLTVEIEKRAQEWKEKETFQELQQISRLFRDLAILEDPMSDEVGVAKKGSRSFRGSRPSGSYNHYQSTGSRGRTASSPSRSYNHYQNNGSWGKTASSPSGSYNHYQNTGSWGKTASSPSGSYNHYQNTGSRGKTASSPSRSYNRYQNTGQAAKNAKGTKHVICKRAPGCNLNKLRENLQDRASPEIQEQYLKRFQEIWASQSHQPIPSPLEKKHVTQMATRTFYSLDLTHDPQSNEELFQALQQHRRFNPTTEAGLLVKMNIGGRVVDFVSVPTEWTYPPWKKNIHGQVGIFTQSESKGFEAATYRDVANPLDAAASDPQLRLNMYKAMLEAIERSPNEQGSLFSDAFPNTDKGQRAREAATELIVISHTAEAVPSLRPSSDGASGRTPGSDELLRAFLRLEIEQGGKKSFKQFIGDLPFTCKSGGTACMRMVAGNDKVRNSARIHLEELDKAAGYMSPPRGEGSRPPSPPRKRPHLSEE